MLLPLLIAVSTAHAFTVLMLKRSILTEKIARRGYPRQPRVLDRSARDPVRARGDAQRRGAADRRAARTARRAGAGRRRWAGRSGSIPWWTPAAGWPVWSPASICTSSPAARLAIRRPASTPSSGRRQRSPIRTNRCGSIAHRMAETGLTHFPVVERGSSRRLLGMVSLESLLEARSRNLEVGAPPRAGHAAPRCVPLRTRPLDRNRPAL